MEFETRAIHACQDPDPSTGATIAPIYLSSTYTQRSPGETLGYDFARSNNPTRDGLEACLASLEGGEACAAFASGLAATSAVLDTLAPGDGVVA
jgi:cystathionine beta-lyase/cystathionine gamma-synthase